MVMKPYTGSLIIFWVVFMFVAGLLKQPANVLFVAVCNIFEVFARLLLCKVENHLPIKKI